MNVELAKRAIACKHWRWMAGMLIASANGNCRLSELDFGWIENDDRDLLPDLDDPATVGCLLALVREAWESRRGEDHVASTVHTSIGWGVGAKSESGWFSVIVLPSFSSEAAALVAALEAAP